MSVAERNVTLCSQAADGKTENKKKTSRKTLLSIIRAQDFH